MIRALLAAMGNPLSELGIELGDEKILANIDHELLLKASPSLEEPLRKALLSIAESSRDTSKALRILAFAGAAYLIMSGLARIIEATKGSGGGGEVDGGDDGTRDDAKHTSFGTCSKVGGGGAQDNTTRNTASDAAGEGIKGDNSKILARSDSLQLSCLTASDDV